MDSSKKNHFKTLFLFFLFSYVNFIIYNQVQYLSDGSHAKSESVSSANAGVSQSLDSLIYYIFGCEFIFLLIKLYTKILKFVIEITQLYMQKAWELKAMSFNIINIIKYAVKLAIEIVNILK